MNSETQLMKLPRLIIIPVRDANVFLLNVLFEKARNQAYSFDYRTYIKVIATSILTPGDDRRFDESFLQTKASLLNLGFEYEEVAEIEHSVTCLLVDALSPYYDLLNEIREMKHVGFNGFNIEVSSNANEIKIWLQYHDYSAGYVGHRF